MIVVYQNVQGSNHDALGRPTQISDSGGGTLSYTYNVNDVLLKGKFRGKPSSTALMLVYSPGYHG